MNFEDELLVLVGGLFLVLLALIIVVCILTVVGRWKVFKKAGKEGWEALIPVYSDWVYVEISGVNWWYFLLIIMPTLTMFVKNNSIISVISPLISMVGYFFCNYNISKRFHKDTGTAILLTLFPIIVLLVIGVSKKYVWDSSVVLSPNGPVVSNNTTTNTFTTVNNNGQNQTFQEQSNNLKFCPFCGTKLTPNDKFCTNCGKEQP